MKLSLKFDFKKSLSYILKRFSLVLWVFLGLVVIAEALTIKASVSQILQANAEQAINNAKLLRVNFETYNSIEKRLTTNSSFIPSESTGIDPFGVAPNKQN